MKKRKIILPFMLVGLASTSLSPFVSCGSKIEKYIKISNLKKQYYSLVGESKQTEKISILFFDGGEIIDVTSSATIELESSTPEIIWNNNDQKVVWSDNLSAGEYEFTLKAAYQVDEKTYLVDFSSKLIVGKEIQFNNIQSEYNGVLGEENNTNPISLMLIDKESTVDITSLSHISISCDLHDEIRWNKSEKTIVWSNNIEVGTYNFTLNASYTDSDQRTYETKFDSKLTIGPARRIEIQGLQNEYSTTVGQANKTSPVSVWLFEKTQLQGEETKTEVTPSASIQIKQSQTPEITYNNNDKTVNWTNNIDAGTYTFTLQAKYRDSDQVEHTFDCVSQLVVGKRQKDLIVDTTSLRGNANCDESHEIKVLFLPEDKVQPIDVTQKCTIEESGAWPENINYNSQTHSINWTTLSPGTYGFGLSITYGEQEITKTFTYELEVRLGWFETCDWNIVADQADLGLKPLHDFFARDCDDNVDYPGTLIGLTRKIKIGVKEYDAMVIDEDHDTIWEQTNKAPLTFMVYCSDIKQRFEDAPGGSNYWGDCALRKYLSSDLINSLDQNVRDNIKEIEKYTHELEYGPTKYNEKLCPLSLVEVNEKGKQTDEGALYTYFDDDASMKRSKIGDSWLRSPRLDPDFWEQAYYINSDGGARVKNVDGYLNVCFTFCI